MSLRVKWGDRVRIPATGETATVIYMSKFFSKLCQIELDNGERCYAYTDNLILIREVSYDPVRKAIDKRMKRHVEDGLPL